MNAVADLTLRLLPIYEDVDDEQARNELSLMLRRLKDRLVSDALHEYGYPRKGDYEDAGRHEFRSKILFATGRELDPNAACAGLTKTGYHCRNRPLLGIDYCHVHCTEASREESRAVETRWVARKTEALERAHLKVAYQAICDATGDIS